MKSLLLITFEVLCQKLLGIYVPYITNYKLENMCYIFFYFNFFMSRDFLGVSIHMAIIIVACVCTLYMGEFEAVWAERIMGPEVK